MLTPVPTWLLVALGGAVGTCARYGLGLVVVARGGAPALTTGVVNVVGCFLIGLLYAKTDDPLARRVLGVGLLGGFTTFSAFGRETLELLRADRLDLALASVGGNLVLGVLAAWLGQRAAA